MKKFLRILCLALGVILAVSVCACGSSEKEGSVETIKIGLAFPMSGMAAMAGKYSTHGADVLKEELGGKITVGDKEYPIEFVVMDTEGLEEKTANVYQKLIEEEKVIAIAGPDSSKCMLAAAPIARLPTSVIIFSALASLIRSRAPLLRLTVMSRDTKPLASCSTTRMLIRLV